MRTTFTFLLLIAFLYSYTQDGDTTFKSRINTESTSPGTLTLPTIPEILPAAPEPTSLIQHALGSANKATGALSATIPLYDIKLGSDFTFPISINYFSQGLKATDVGTTLGMGWSLVGGGTIVRHIKGRADELATRTTVPDNISNTTANISLLNSLSSRSSLDAQPDEYIFNVNGMSGKFVINSNYQAVTTSADNLKIDLLSPGYAPSGFVITDPNGVRYFFDIIGYSENINGKSTFMYDGKLATTYYLSSIALRNGRTISFSYLSYEILNDLDRKQTLTYTTTIYNSCGQVPVSGGRTSDYQDIVSVNEYDVKYLSQITTNTGEYISFNYNTSPYFGVNNNSDRYLSSVSCSGLYDYVFRYQFLNQPNSRFKRFFLEKLVKKVFGNVGQNSGDSLVYQMEYNNLQNVPPPSTVNQDLLGFYNSSANVLVSPVTPFEAMQLTGRSADFSSTVTGTLSAITYPTGGKEHFFYELNKSSSWSMNQQEPGECYVEGTTYATLESRPEVFPKIAFEELRSARARSNIQTTSTTFLTNTTTSTPGQFWCDLTQTATLTANGQNNDPDDTNLNFYVVSVYENNVLVFSGAPNSGSTTMNVQIPLTANNWYRIELKIYSTHKFANVNIVYTKTTGGTPIQVDKNFYGLRVKEIRRTDPVTGNAHSTYYKYGSLTNTEFSSLQEPAIVNVYSYNMKTVCTQGDLSLEGNGFAEYSYKVFSSDCVSNINDLNDGNPINYLSIIETNDLALNNGGVQYTFSPYSDGARYFPVQGQYPFTIPGGQAPTLSGKPVDILTFDRQKNTVSQESFDYEMNLSPNPVVHSYLVSRHSRQATSLESTEDFDIVKLFYSQNWIRLKSSVKSHHAGTGIMVDSTFYTYGSFSNILPKIVRYKDSRSNTRMVSTTYATDYPNDPVAQKMVNNNLKQAIITDSSFLNNNVQKVRKVTYHDWFNNGTQILPFEEGFKQSPTDNLRKIVAFNNYDAYGNIQEQQKANDVKDVYLWGYQSLYPVVKVTGSNYATVSGIVAQASIDAATSAPGNDVAVRTLLQNIRSYFAGNKQVQVSTYTYKPLVGITSETDPTGRTIYYEYDSFNRLKLQKDEQGNILKKYCYNYAGQLIDCN